MLRYSWLITCLFSTLKQSVEQVKRYLRDVTKVFYMRDIFETSQIRLRVVYGGHRIKNLIYELSSCKFCTRIWVLESMLF